ncbi:hypothetical protein CBR_g66790 [Chara braunii]|uniref:Reverse transcriptase domain-containing protein n=1 Tax=Chara braunii TaxID=69332 RepID=A0A388K9A1_CHABU|nr:hypothetical protein CBR_g66790 [Chara braunii]|eukprot:GBG66654.1 hypothetical protein CBR_g66790 [Chara braunii]
MMNSPLPLPPPQGGQGGGGSNSNSLVGNDEAARIKSLLDLCFDDGIFPETNIDFGMTEIVDGVGILTLNDDIDTATVNWLKARTVIVLFDEPAMSLSVAQREQLIRVYEDAWYLDATVNPSQKRGRTHGEGPNVTSYVARSERIAEWMVMKGEDRIPTRSGSVKVKFKPWMTKQELETMRDNEMARKFRIIALRVPLEALFPLKFAIEKFMGKVLIMHPPEKRAEEPRLGNVRIDCAPEVKDRFMEWVVVRKPGGGFLEVQFANQDTPFCNKCLWWYHDEFNPECPRFNEPMLEGRGGRGRGRRDRGREEEAWGEEVLEAMVGGYPGMEELTEAEQQGGRKGVEEEPLAREEVEVGKKGVIGEGKRVAEMGWWGTTVTVEEEGQRPRREVEGTGETCTTEVGAVKEGDNLVLAGDFNTVLQPGVDSPAVEPVKADARQLSCFIEAYELTDTFRRMNLDCPGYTWHSVQRSDDLNVPPPPQRRLDLILAKGEAWEAAIQTEVVPDPLSDHWPVVMDLRLNAESKRKTGFFRLNSEHLKNPGVLEWCAKYWIDWEQTKGWFEKEEEWAQVGFRMVTRALDVFSRILTRERNQEEDECREMVKEAEDNIGRDPITDLYWERRRDVWMNKWEILQVEQQEEWAKRARERGMTQMDRMSKETFRRLCPARQNGVIRALLHPFNSQADLAEDTESMAVYAATYYSDILTSRRPANQTLEELQSEEDLWQFTDKRLAQHERISLDRPLTLEELKAATTSMARGKASGDDGLPVEFYAATWETVGLIQLRLYNRVLEGEALTEDMCRGVITLLYKKGGKQNVRNWRPISLLNVSYKILAKALARRLANHLPEMVKADQGAFVKGRSIAENILVAMGALEIISREDRQVVVAMLDLEKTYDRVNWSFVLATLEHMNFGECFRKWVAVMYQSSTATVLINGSRSNNFHLSRSLRQGCLLAPLLFVVQMEVTLNAIRASPRIRGLQLRMDKVVTTGAIADDILLITEATSESMDAAKQILDQYSTMSEAQVNWDKSVYFLP